MKDFRAIWGENIRQARLALSLTQVELCRRVGVTQQALSKWERGVNAPTDEYRFLLARVLRQTIQGLFPPPVIELSNGEGEAA